MRQRGAWLHCRPKAASVTVSQRVARYPRAELAGSRTTAAVAYACRVYAASRGWPRVFRALSLPVVVAAATAAAHLLGGGMVDLAATAVVGASVLPFTLILTRIRLRGPAIAAILGVGQLLGHAEFSMFAGDHTMTGGCVSGGHHAQLARACMSSAESTLSAAMLAWHLAVTLLLTIVLLRAEAWWWRAREWFASRPAAWRPVAAEPLLVPFGSLVLVARRTVVVMEARAPPVAL